MKKLSYLILCTCVALIPTIVKADLVFTVVVDENFVAPGGNGSNFISLSEPVIDNGQIVFRGQDSNSSGFYLYENGVITRVVDTLTMIPGEENTFALSTNLQRTSISNGRIAFVSVGSASGGVFVAQNNQIDSLVRNGDSVPATMNSTFQGFRSQHIENGTTVFLGAFGAFTSGIYTSDGNNLNKVIDSTDGVPIPGVNFDFSSFTPTDLENQTILFTGGGFNSTTGIYQSTFSGSISVVVDINTPIPDGVGNFTFFDSRFPNVDNGQVVFVGSGSNSQMGIYLADGNGITKIADRNTLQPGSNNPFSDLREPIIDNGRVFFQGNGTEGQAIYKFEDGEISRVVGEGDSINGQQLTQIVQNVLTVDGNTLVFNGLFGIFNSAIIKVDLVSPGDLNCDGIVDLLDVNPFIDALANGTFLESADVNQDGAVNLLDVDPFIELLNIGG